MVGSQPDAPAGRVVVGGDVRAELDRLQAYWLRQASTIPSLGYKKRNDGRTLGLLQSPEQGRWEPFTCLNSLRDVEPTANLILADYNLDDDGGEDAEEEGAAP